ncbi:TRAP transporter large permease [Piscinibacter sp.]|uniref:TRAP transporter large permease n=1 Tax=Piscinibacter sp. TaxID=1903157 RepID=UPI002B5A2E25|nr:TRAP transporter large permease subunit [Albitalea sp.]HUG21076.1 TRAP transporter large permease subunit [Albitalea sp.]
MFAALALFLLTGVPVAFALAACGLTFGLIGIELGVLPAELLQALPLRLFGIISNETLLAIPFFTFMGLILQRSGMAEDLLETVGQVFGPVRGGLALAVVFVGALLAATTGVVAASVISMGLISLPIMLRNGYNRRLACGVITASGSLAQVVPPSLVLIVMADQLGRSVGDMYAGALLPAALLIGLYAAMVALMALFRPRWAPALPLEARTFREASGLSGHRSLAVLFVISALAGWALLQAYPALLRSIGRTFPPPPDETVMVALAGGVLTAFVLALLDSALRLGWLSALARRVAFVLIPPLILIFLVLGTIFLGVATPTEGGALGAVGALTLAGLRRRLTLRETGQALLSTTKLACFVMFVLIGATVFSLTFQGVDGPIWVEHLFDKLPGGATGFLIFVTILVFLLGFFLDFFEIAFVLLPLLAPIANKLGIDLIWFGVLVGINLQTSFMTPPFGFSLFYLRSVAPQVESIDAATGRTMPRVTTGDIYIGSLPFVGVQVLVMALIIMFPALVIGDAAKKDPFDRSVIEEQLREMGPDRSGDTRVDPMQQLLDSMRRDK